MHSRLSNKRVPAERVVDWHQSAPVEHRDSKRSEVLAATRRASQPLPAAQSIADPCFYRVAPCTMTRAVDLDENLRRTIEQSQLSDLVWLRQDT